LSAAIVLAQAGLSVLVREANSTIGGGARSLPLTLPGFIHDIGSAVHPMAVASPFFRSLPLTRYGLEWIQPPLSLVHPLDNAPSVVLGRTIEETAVTISPDGAAYRHLLGPLVRDWKATIHEILSPPIHLPSHPFALAQFGLRALWPAAGLSNFVFRGDRAKALLAGCAGHSIVPLEKIGSSAIALVMAGCAHACGWPIPRGGSQQITDALAACLRSLGGTIETEAPVDSLDSLPPRRALLFDLSPRQVARIAGDRLGRGYLASLRRFNYGPGIFKIDWALSSPIPWKDPECARTATLHIGGTLQEISASERAAWDGRVDSKPFLLLAQQSLFDSSRGPVGRHTGWAYCHVPNGSTRDMTEAIESQVERFAPGFRDVILARATRNTAQMQESNANLIGGDIGGGANNLWQLLFRPTVSFDPYRMPIDNMYLCSSSTPPGGGVHGMCGYHAARSALRHTFGR
jgi:phytoene dehydrogenase-like protein